ncbi:MAG: sulfotransferase domain-containing protein [Actinomycetota bacterium]|nr:sulfotransferase domain-containing protein [Actinomycetota bacterium]
MKTDFMVIGAQKSGTSSLSKQIGGHPEICFSDREEPQYFNAVDDWRARLDEYHRLFQAKPGQLCGEGSTTYTFFPEYRDTPQRLFEYNSELKFIYIMRHPVDRIASNYAWDLVRRMTDDHPDKAVLERPHYVNRSRYALQIRPFLELFGRDKLLLLVFEEYIRDPVASLKQVAEYLGVSPTPFQELDISPKHASVGVDYRTKAGQALFNKKFVQKVAPYVPKGARALGTRPFKRRLHHKPEISNDVREALGRLLADDVRAVEGLMGRRIDLWRGEEKPVRGWEG